MQVLRTVLISIQVLMSSPLELEDSDRVLNAEAASHYTADRGAFNEKAREWARIYAQPRSEAGGLVTEQPQPSYQ